MHDQYKHISQPEQHLAPCPVCASAAQLWQYSESPTSPTSKAVMCSNGDAIGPEVGVASLANEGCPLYMPRDQFYKATIHEAVKFWNEYADALVTQREQNSSSNAA